MAGKGNILIVDDEKDIRYLIREILEDEGFTVAEAPHSEAAHAEIAKSGMPDLVILDIWLENSEQDGMEILADLKKRARNLPVIMISGHGNIEMAVKAIKLGAYDFIEKPFNIDRLLHLVNRAMESSRLRRAAPVSTVSVVATTPDMQAVVKAAQKAAQGEARLIITGAWGSGRGHLARWIHQESARAGKPFITVASAEMDSGAIADQIAAAADGTLVFRDIQLLSTDAQAVLLAKLNGKPAMRIMATAAPDIDERRKAGSFSSDLYERLSVVAIALPPLEDRRGDIAELANLFLAENFAQWSIQRQPHLAEDTIAALRRTEWRGQIAELRAACMMAALRMALSGAHDAQAAFFFGDAGLAAPAPQSDNSSLQAWLGTDLRTAREAFERWYFENLMERFEGNVSQMATFAGMDRTALHRKLKALKEGEGDSEQSGERLAS